MGITVDEFHRLRQICEPRRSLNLESPLTAEIMNEAVHRLPSYLVGRLEAAKSMPRKEWPSLVFPRKDGLGSITPAGVDQAVCHVFWKLARIVEHVTREKASSEPMPLRPAENGNAQCPWCGRLLILPKE